MKVQLKTKQAEAVTYDELLGIGNSQHEAERRGYTLSRFLYKGHMLRHYPEQECITIPSPLGVAGELRQGCMLVAEDVGPLGYLLLPMKKTQFDELYEKVED